MNTSAKVGKLSDVRYVGRETRRGADWLLRLKARRPVAFWLPVAAVAVIGVCITFWTAIKFVASANVIRVAQARTEAGLGAVTARSELSSVREAILSEQNIQKSARDAGIDAAIGKNAELTQQVRNAALIDFAAADGSHEAIQIELRGHSAARVTALTAALAQNFANDTVTSGGTDDTRVESAAATMRVSFPLMLFGALGTVILGLLAGFASVVVAEYADTTFHSVEEASEHFQIPVVGVAPLTRAQATGWN